MDFGAALIDWTTEAERALSAASWEPTDIEQWRKEWQTGHAQLWQFNGQSQGYLLTRVEVTEDQRREWVLVAGAGINARPVLRWAKDMARRCGFHSLRTHIKRPGLRRMYEAQGWQLAEQVMKVEINGRQVEKQQ